MNHPASSGPYWQDPALEASLLVAHVQSAVLHLLNNVVGVQTLVVDELKELRNASTTVNAVAVHDALIEQTKRLQQVTQQLKAWNRARSGDSEPLRLTDVLPDALVASGSGATLDVRAKTGVVQANASLLPWLLHLIAHTTGDVPAKSLRLEAATSPQAGAFVGWGEPSGDAKPVQELLGRFFHEVRGIHELRLLAISELVRKWGGLLEAWGPASAPTGLRIYLREARA